MSNVRWEAVDAGFGPLGRFGVNVTGDAARVDFGGGRHGERGDALLLRPREEV
jgi:hypothetical protein